MTIDELNALTDGQLNAKWAEQFGGSGNWAQDESKLNLDFSDMPESQQIEIGNVVAYYYPSQPDADPFCFYARILGVPNRPIMIRLLAEIL